MALCITALGIFEPETFVEVFFVFFEPEEQTHEIDSFEMALLSIPHEINRFQFVLIQFKIG